MAAEDRTKEIYFALPTASCQDRITRPNCQADSRPVGEFLNS